MQINFLDTDEDQEAKEEVKKTLSKTFGLYRRDTPQYLFEGYTSEDEYESAMVRLVDDLLEESKSKWRDLKQRWGKACLRLELFESLAAKAGIDKTDLPITPQAIEEAVALLVEGLARPKPAPRDAEQDKFVGVLSHFFDRELDANNFDLLMGKVIFNQKCMFMGIIKTVFEPGKPGPYTEDGRITMRSVDARYFWPDPLAKGLSFEDSRYWIFAEPEDTADVRRRFPRNGHLVKPASEYSLSRQSSQEESLETVGDYTIKNRQRVLVKECWIRDDRKVFVPELNENGEEQEIDGVILGEWVAKYPNGRLLVVAGDVLLADMPNPMPHGEPPYTLFPARTTTTEMLSWADVELLGRIEDKINRIHKDMIRNARVNMNSPWVVDRHAFDSPKKFNLLTQDPGLVLPVAPGARIMRLPPAELPQFIFPLLSWLRGIFDDLLGVQGVMRGQLEKGSQLSADAVENLQITSTSRLRYRNRIVEAGLKRLGHQLEWMIRHYYPSDFKVQVTDPRNGGKQDLAWTTPPEKMGNFEIEMQVGSGLPGSKEGGASLYLKLWQLGLIPRAVALSALRVPNAEKVAELADQEDAKRALLGITARQNKTGAAGRKALGG